jgi:hypothetical protein
MRADEFAYLEREGKKPNRQGSPSLGRPRQTVHWSELAEDTSGTPAAKDWNAYLREVGRLLAQGHEGKWVLIKGAEIIGIWDTEEEANQVRLQGFLGKDVLVHQILTHEPLLRGPTYLRSCPG